jgi:microcystin-dependent protein
MESMIGQVTIFAGNFAPQGWMLCQGQLLSISQYEAVFSVLGTTYGGDGQTTFALPNIAGRAPVHPGQSTSELGQFNGAEMVTLTSAQMPAHNHSILANSAAGTSALPSGQVPSMGLDGGSGTEYNIYETTADGTMAANSVTMSGGNQPHDNMSPFLAINYIICIEGIFPSRN